MPLTATRPAPTFGALLLRGLLAGLVAGLLAGLFAYTLGEPKVDTAIAIEEAAAAAAPAPAEGEEGHSHGDEASVSRGGQKGGLFLATGLYGVAMGGLLATAYTVLRRRLRTGDDARAGLGLAAAALAGLVLVPFVKYPPNPPAVGDPATINQRTIGYLAIVVIGLVAVWAGVLAFRALRPGAGEVLRLTAAVVAFLLVVVVGYVLLPNIDEVPDGFPPSLLWNFRVTSLGTQVTLWVTLGLTFAALLARLGAAARPAERQETESVPV